MHPLDEHREKGSGSPAPFSLIIFLALLAVAGCGPPPLSCGTPEDCHRLAEACRRTGLHERSAAIYSELLMQRPDDDAALEGRGLALKLLRQYEAAAWDFSRAIAIDPTVADYHNDRGNAYNGLGDSGKALEDYTRALALDPEHTWAHVNRGYLLLTLGRFEAALADLNAALKRTSYPKAVYNRSIAYEELGRLGEAMADIRAYRMLAPDAPEGPAAMQRLAFPGLGDRRKPRIPMKPHPADRLPPPVDLIQ